MCRSIETAFIILYFALKEPDFLVILWSGLKQQFSRLSKGSPVLVRDHFQGRISFCLLRLSWSWVCFHSFLSFFGLSNLVNLNIMWFQVCVVFRLFLIFVLLSEFCLVLGLRHRSFIPSLMFLLLPFVLSHWYFPFCFLCLLPVFGPFVKSVCCFPLCLASCVPTSGWSQCPVSIFCFVKLVCLLATVLVTSCFTLLGPCPVYATFSLTSPVY